MSAVVIYVNDQKLFSIPESAYTEFLGGCLVVHDRSDETDLDIVFAYQLKPGQYAKVQMVDGVQTVKINE